jgi:hypothetical protein
VALGFDGRRTASGAPGSLFEERSPLGDVFRAANDVLTEVDRIPSP